LENFNTCDYQTAHKALDKTGMGTFVKSDYQELSGGEKQLVWLSQLLLQNSDIYLLDEPTQSLDLKNKKRVFGVIENEFIKKGKTVLCITHDLHYLYNMDGYLLNLSDKKPQLEKITKLSIDKAIEVLYQ
jgi:iron complex transport system ATP-binding protein